MIEKEEAGYYNLQRRAVKAYLSYDPQEAQAKAEVIKQQYDIYTRALQQADSEILKEAGVEKNVLGMLKNRLPKPKSY